MKYLFFLAVLLVAFAQTRYDGYKVVKLVLPSSLVSKVDTTIDVWTREGILVGESENEIFVSPDQYLKLTQDFKKEIEAKTVHIQVLNEDYQKVIDEEQFQMEVQRQKAKYMTQEQSLSEEWFKTYHRYPEISKFVEKMHKDFPQHTQLFTIGKTFENRTIVGIRAFGNGSFDPKRKSVFINGNQHAREWLSAPTVLYIMWQLLKDYKAGKPEIVSLLNKVNVHLVPIVNPDGYEYSFTSRMWRKNRFRNRDGSYGVDLNRNFVYAFGGPGSSGVPSSETYRGASALSELESKAVDEYLKKYPFVAGIDYHSFSQYILRPWDAHRNPTPDEAALTKVTNAWRTEMRKVHNVDYASLRGAEMYVHSGGLMDHFYAVRKFFGFCVELRPRSGGFVIDPRNIIPSGQENYKGFLEVLKYASEK